jgi:GNAT superfamily N-acetyltransferase
MSEISFSYTTEGLTDEDLSPFFVGWLESPGTEPRRKILDAASEVVLARDEQGALVGFITAITDGIFAAYIPLLEVRAERRLEGIGRALVERMLGRLDRCYMIDLVCDEDVIAFYQKLGGQRLNAVVWRNFDALNASGESGGDLAEQ